MVLNTSTRITLRPYGPTSLLLHATNGLGCYIHTPPKGWRLRHLTTYIYWKCREPPLGIPLCGHMQQGLMLRIPSVTPIWLSSACGTSLHRHNISLTLLSSLHVKGLTRRCYVCNDKAYMLAFSLLNFQGDTKLTNHNHTWATWATWANFTILLQATNELGCYIFLSICILPLHCIQTSR